MQTFEGQPIISDQVNAAELAVIMRELRKVLNESVAGDVVELGCYEGTTSLFLQRELIKTNKKLQVYDSFAGLPDKTVQDQSPAGTQFVGGALLASKKRLIANFKKAGLPLPIIHKAWFNQLEFTDLPKTVCFAFLDGDFYESIKDSLNVICPSMEQGGVIIIDDYQNEALPGVQKAVDEFCQDHYYKVNRVEQSLAVIYT